MTDYMIMILLLIDNFGIRYQGEKLIQLNLSKFIGMNHCKLANDFFKELYKYRLELKLVCNYDKYY